MHAECPRSLLLSFLLCIVQSPDRGWFAYILAKATGDISPREKKVSHKVRNLSGERVRERKEREEEFPGCGKGGLCLKRIQRMGLWSWHQAVGRKAWVSNKSQQGKKTLLPSHAGPGMKEAPNYRSPLSLPALSCHRESRALGRAALY